MGHEGGGMPKRTTFYDMGQKTVRRRGRALSKMAAFTNLLMTTLLLLLLLYYLASIFDQKIKKSFSISS